MDLSIFNGCAWLAWVAYWYLAAMFVNRTKSSEGYAQRLLHMLPMGIGFFLIFHDQRSALVGGQRLVSEPVRWFGTALTVGGLLFAIWARVHLGRYWSGIITLKQDHKLIRTGPYQFVRHPIYTGFVAAALGSALVIGTADALVGFPFILAACLFKIRREEAVLTREFGDEYRAFQREVATLVPFLL